MAADERTITEARDHLADVVNRVTYGHTRVRLTKHGRCVAAVISAEELELLELLEDRADLEAAREALRESGSVAWKDVKAELGL
jgi:prevent-host-death family protein